MESNSKPKTETSSPKESFMARLKAKKRVIGIGLGLVFGALGAFALGKKMSVSPVAGVSNTHESVDASGEADHSEGEVEHSDAVATTKSHSEGDSPEGHDRAPASSPEDGTDEEEEEEEIEIKLADHLKKAPPKKETHEVTAHDPHGNGHEKVEEEKGEPEVAAHTDAHAVGHAEAHHSKEGFFNRLLTMSIESVTGFQAKLESVKRADEETKILKKENATLRLMLETKKYSCRVEEAKTIAKTVGEHLNATTGTSVGRTLSSIRYQIPENLLPDQLHALGVSYFKLKDDEKAVTIFSFLTELESDTIYKTSENYLLTAISWYRLENYKKSAEYLDLILKGIPGKERERYQIQAKLWKALVGKKLSNRTEVAKWIQNTVENHPHSKEARWVNPQGEEHRKPAQEEESHEDPHAHPSH
jgi:hypothetical protein